MSELEADQTRYYCSLCGRQGAKFDLFCAGCAHPFLRGFWIIFAVEAALFLAVAICLSLARSHVLSSTFLLAPSAYVAQLLGLYVGRFALHQVRFVPFLAIYVVFLWAAVSGFGIERALVCTAPLYLLGGSVLLWISRVSAVGWASSMRTLWLGILVICLSLVWFAGIDSVVQRHIQENQLFTIAQRIVSRYTPWLALVGVILTVTVQAARTVSASGVSVKPDYFSWARVIPPDLTSLPIPYALPLVPLVVLVRAIRRAALVLYGTVVDALNVVTRGLVFVWHLVTAFAVASFRHGCQTVIDLVRYAVRTFSRVAIPFVCAYVIAAIVIRSNKLMQAHMDSGSVSTGLAIVSHAFVLLLVLLAAVLFLARIDIRPFLFTYLFDAAILGAYSAFIIPACTLALLLGGKVSAHYFGIRLGYQFGPISWACSSLMAAAGVFVWQKGMIRLLRLAQVGKNGADG